MVRGAVETEVDAEGDGRPCRILLAAVEADLAVQAQSVYHECRYRDRNPSRRVKSAIEHVCRLLALLAGLDFSFSKIFSDCCLVARALILAGLGSVQERRLSCLYPDVSRTKFARGKKKTLGACAFAVVRWLAVMQ